jgi:phosphoglycolate phosphatase-like HAD superfamily hydrolase
MVDRTETWMRELAAHFRGMRLAYPEEELAVVFDIDGTIVDTRHLVVHLLIAYDRLHGTEHFRGIRPSDIDSHETQIDAILEPFALPAPIRAHVRAWYLEHLRDPDAIAAAHRPYEGVLGVIRWFQLQPRTHVVLNTGRPEWMRGITLDALNALGAAHRVRFDPDLLFMEPSGDSAAVAEAKVRALRTLRSRGYRIVAVFDNEPEMLRAMSLADEEGEILFLHADTIFLSRREPPPRTVAGSRYRLADLVDEREIGRRVTFVWHGANDRRNLRHFLASDVRWAELDVRLDPLGRAVLRHDPFSLAAWARDEELLPLGECLATIRAHGRAVKIDLKEDGPTLEAVLREVAALGFPDEELWFNGAVEALGAEGFRRIRREHPGAIVQAPVEFLVPLLLAAPELADRVLRTLAEWGIDRVSLDWRTPRAREALDALERLGWSVNLYGVPDLESFLEAALLLPASVTADFNFPRWDYLGTGPARAPEIASLA